MMENTVNPKERVHQINLINDSAEEVRFYLTPDGKEHKIPSKEEYKVIFRQDADFPVELVINKNNKVITFYSIVINKVHAAVYADYELISGIEEVNLTEVNQNNYDLTVKYSNKIRLTNDQNTEVSFILDSEKIGITIPPSVTYEVIWKKQGNYSVDFVFGQHPVGSFHFSLYTQGALAEVYKDGELIYPIYGEDGEIRLGEPEEIISSGNN